MTVVRDSISGAVGRAIAELAQDGIALSVTRRNQSLRQSGIRDDLEDTLVTIAPLAAQAEETLLTTDGITTVVTTDAVADQTLTVVGHTLDSGDFTEVTQTVTLNGHTGAALTTPLARISRATNTSSTVLLGDVYFYEGGGTTSGVPNDLTEVHLQIPAGRQTSKKLATTTAATDYWFITEIGFSVMRNPSAIVDVCLEIAPPGEVFRSIFDFSVSSAAASPVPGNPDPLLIVPNNADLRMRALGPSTGPTTMVAGHVAGYLALLT